MELLHELLVEQFDYIAKKDARSGNPDAGQSGAAVKIGSMGH